MIESMLSRSKRRKLTDEYLRDLHDGSSDHDANAECFGNGQLETLHVSEIQSLDQTGVAFLN